MSDTEYWATFWANHGERTRHDAEHRQVLRTSHGQPIADDIWEAVRDDLRQKLAISAGTELLDVCCGNGMLTRDLAPSLRSIHGVDISPALIDTARDRAPTNATYGVLDMRKLDQIEGTYDRILVYAAFQYLTHTETLHVLQELYAKLKPGGRVVLGDLPDHALRWQFFNTPERRTAYFTRVREGEPIIGTWFDRTWLEYAAIDAGFTRVETSDQEAPLPYRHFRFDSVLHR